MAEEDRCTGDGFPDGSPTRPASAGGGARGYALGRGAEEDRGAEEGRRRKQESRRCQSRRGGGSRALIGRSASPCATCTDSARTIDRRVAKQRLRWQLSRRGR